MAKSILSQTMPPATTLTDIYTVPADKTCSIMSIVVCNQDGGAGSFRLSLAVAGAADASTQYINYDEAIAAHTTTRISMACNLYPTDIIRAYSSSGNISFTILGIEN